MSLVAICCPHCGRELNVPEDAGDIVCMFCAQPVDVRAVLAARKDTESEAANWEELLSDGLFTVRLNADNFNVSNYPDEFERYAAEFRPALEAFRCDALADPGEEERFAETLLCRFREKRETKRRESFDFRLTITALTVPAILSLETGVAERAADLFLEKWNAAFPRERLGKATYEQIESGFHHKLCYITTAACKALGAGDDCTELNEFRAFRDDWLAHEPEGRAKITEYYLFAPMIVRAIDASGRAQEEYSHIWEAHLAPCLRLIRAGRREECARSYGEMVRSLEAKWLS